MVYKTIVNGVLCISNMPKNKKATKRKIKTKTLVNFILDKSGSMSSVWDATISGFNEYLNTLRKDGNEYDFSLTLFDTEINKREVNVPIKTIKELDRLSYVPSGMTALYDATCNTIDEVKKSIKKGIKVLTVVMTDGEENSSKEYTQEQFKNKVKELEKTKMWSFIFLGANQDAWLNAQKYGFQAGSVATYNSTQAGTRAVFTMMASNTATAASSKDFSRGGGGVGDFFSTTDKDALKKAK